VQEWLKVSRDIVLFAYTDSQIEKSLLEERPFTKMEPTKQDESKISLKDFFGSHIAEAISTIKKMKE